MKLPMENRQIARWYGFGRLGIGAGMAVAPALLMKGWFGSAVAGQAATKAVTRMFGVREAVVGAAMVSVAKQNDRDAIRRWAMFSAACDATDVLVALRNLRRLDRRSSLLVLLAASTGVATGAHIAAHPDD